MILDGYGPPGANLLHFLIEFYSEMKHFGEEVEAGAARSKFASFLNRILLRNEQSGTTAFRLQDKHPNSWTGSPGSGVFN